MKRRTLSSEEGSQCRVNFYLAILSWPPTSYHLFITFPPFIFQSIKQETNEFEEDESL